MSGNWHEGEAIGLGADAYFRTDDDKVRHRLVTMADATEKTIADEFRTAVDTLRKAAESARRNGHLTGDSLLRQLADPVADWLEKTAKGFSEQVISDQAECPACGDGCYADHGALLTHDGGCGGVLLSEGADRCKCFDGALAVARALNDTSPEVPRV